MNFVHFLEYVSLLIKQAKEIIERQKKSTGIIETVNNLT